MCCLIMGYFVFLVFSNDDGNFWGKALIVGVSSVIGFFVWASVTQTILTPASKSIGNEDDL